MTDYDTSVEQLARTLVAIEKDRQARVADRHSPRSHARSPIARWWRRRMLPPTHPRALGLISVQMLMNPFELLFLVAVTGLGIAYVSGVPVPGSVDTVLPVYLDRLWEANLAVGGLVGLIAGTRTRHLALALKFVQSAWFLIMVATFAYSISISIVYGMTGLYTAVVNMCVSIAAATRIVQIQRFFIVATHLTAFDRDQAAKLLGQIDHPDGR